MTDLHALLRIRHHIGSVIERATGDSTVICDQVRPIVRDAVIDQDFVIACVEHTALAFERQDFSNPPIVDDEEREFSIRLIPWPKSVSNHPHRHDHWTVTAVMAGRLRFEIYEERSGNLSLQRAILAQRGEAGAIVPPCIHRVVNENDGPSLSLHVFSGKRALQAHAERRPYQRGQTVWYGAPDSQKPTVLDLVYGLLSTLSQIEPAMAIPPLRRLCRRGPANCRMAAIKALALLDLGAAKDEAMNLANVLDDQNALALRNVVSGL
ncbi:MAG: hypothetical protein KKB66_11275 [Alphaproteobacteria bacterium]|nr:hypothetical protein [Alphaproteobacteria bacterium]MBU0804981.1 hypothetical protein [Alphaproteobacteria bacterium]MBU0870480.1 hypothetical protein [Alphaproteobacteria bacterium]MBU1401845.1 hypothetical protein [Alphaproteobacteria bacterium]MBU1591738.1 hypothetical protein [Alphaproteobacteria bacterium]